MTSWKSVSSLILALLLVAGITAGIFIVAQLTSVPPAGGQTAAEQTVTWQHPAVLVGQISPETGLGEAADPDLIRLLEVSVTAGADLGDLARFQNVEQLTLTLEGATDLAVLGKLGKLEQITIHIGHPQALDLSVLSKLSGLRKITLQNVQTENLDDLADLVDLRFLTILNGGVTNLGGLAGNRKLQSLIIDNFPQPGGIPQNGDVYMGAALAAQDLASASTLDLARLGGKPELRTLVVVGSQVTGLEQLIRFPELHALWLLRAGVTDVHAPSLLRHLKDLRLAYNDGISDVTPLAQLLDLETLNLRGTKTADLDMILALPMLENLDLRDTPAATQQLTDVPYTVNVLQ